MPTAGSRSRCATSREPTSSSCCRRRRVLDPTRALTISGQVAAALDAAHARGLVHRDVKPSNVLLDENEHVYLADFGLSRRLAEPEGQPEDRLSVGTPAYVSPEQIESGSVDGRADEYALGCLLYECLTGQAPFSRASELAVLWAHVQEPPPAASEHNPDLPIAIDAVIGKAMAKDPGRPVRTLRRLRRGRTRCARPAPARRDRDRKALILAAVGVALIAAAVLPASCSARAAAPAKPSTKPTLTPKVDSLQRIDPKTNKLVATIAAGAGADGIAAGDGAVFVASTNAQTVSRIDPKSNAIVKRVAAAGAPTSIALGRPPDGPALWVTSPTHSFGHICALSQLDPKTLLTNFTRPRATRVGRSRPGEDRRGSGAARTSSCSSIRARRTRYGRFRSEPSATRRLTAWRWAQAPSGSPRRSPRSCSVSTGAASGRSRSVPAPSLRTSPSARAASGSRTACTTRSSRSTRRETGSSARSRSAMTRSRSQSAPARSGSPTTRAAPSRESIPEPAE